MKQITKIIISHGNLNVYHSDEVIDKRDEYAIRFDSFFKGYVDHCVKKNDINKVLNSQLQCKLYISTFKFNRDSDFWINTVTEAYNSLHNN
jgi:Leu/Phe-tRNA-protein transferase